MGLERFYDSALPVNFHEKRVVVGLVLEASHDSGVPNGQQRALLMEHGGNPRQVPPTRPLRPEARSTLADQRVL